MPDEPPLGILGPLRIVVNGTAVHIQRPRRRSVLAYLLLRAGQVVPVSAMVDAVWGERPPRTARSQIHADIAGIRKALPERWAVRLETVPAGYRFTAGSADVDVLAFAKGLSGIAGADDDTVCTTLRASLALWRGPALCDIDAPFVEAARAHLQEQRLAAYEQLIDAELQRGGEATVAGMLAELVQAEPLRERLHEQLMIVYYRAGRRIDALALARRLRRRLAEEYGLDPSEALLDIERRILRDDRGLLSVSRSERVARVVPRELPADTPDFVGRTAHLAELADALAPSSAPRLIVVAGPSGVGKTTLAVRAARAAAVHYPDGQIFLELHGASAHPTSPMDAQRHALRALGVDDARLPASVDECAARLRTLLADLRVLLVLDDVGDAEQAAQLFPGSAGCAVLMTVRSRLAQPPGVRLLELAGFTDAEAAEFLVTAVGRGPSAEPAAVAEVVRLCRYLPLALRVVGGQLRAYPHRSVGDMAERLRDEQHRLAALAHGSLAVGASIGASVEKLPEVDRRVLAGLAVAELPATAAWLAAWRENLAEPVAAAALDRLTGRYLVGPITGPTAFTCHDLVRLWMRGQSSEGERRRITDGTLAAYHDLALTARAALAPTMQAVHGQPSGRIPADPGTLLPLLDAEMGNFVLVVRQAIAEQRTELAWQLAYLLFGYFDRGRQLANAMTITAYAVHCVRAAGHLDALRIMCGHHAATCNMARRHEEALESLSNVLELAEQSRVPRARMVGHAGLARTLRQLGRPSEAVVHYRAAAQLAAEAADAEARMVLLHNLGAVLADLGELPAASTALETAQQMARERSAAGMQARVSHTLGVVAAARGDLARALELTATAQMMAGDSGHHELEAHAARDLGLLHHQRGEHEQAIKALLSSLAIYTRTGSETGLTTTLRALAAAYHDSADSDRHLDYAHRALLLCRDIPL